MPKARDVAILAELSPAAAGEAELALGAAIQRVPALGEGRPAAFRVERLLPALEGTEQEISAAAQAFNQATAP